MLLAELEVWHTRPAVPTRRIALGHMVLPVDPAPGFGGLLLGSIVAAPPRRHPRRLRPRHPPPHRRGRAWRTGRAATAAPPIPGRSARPGGQPTSFDRPPGGRQRGHLVRLPHRRHRSRPGPRSDLCGRTARAGAPTQHRTGAAEGGSLAGADRLGADRPSRRIADVGARSARRPSGLGDGHPRLRTRWRRRRRSGRSPPSSASRCATCTPTTAGPNSTRPRR